MASAHLRPTGAGTASATLGGIPILPTTRARTTQLAPALLSEMKARQIMFLEDLQQIYQRFALRTVSSESAQDGAREHQTNHDLRFYLFFRDNVL